MNVSFSRLTGDRGERLFMIFALTLSAMRIVFILARQHVKQGSGRSESPMPVLQGIVPTGENETNLNLYVHVAGVASKRRPDSKWQIAILHFTYMKSRPEWRMLRERT